MALALNPAERATFSSAADGLTIAVTTSAIALASYRLHHELKRGKKLKRSFRGRPSNR